MIELWLLVIVCSVVVIYANWPEERQYVKKPKKQNTQDILNKWTKW